MKIAVAYENGNIFQHFGRTEQFKIYEVKDDKIKSEQIIDTNGQGHGALADFLADKKADVLICGGIGAGARSALSAVGVKIFGGVSGSVDSAVKDYISGKLQFDPDVNCDHNHHEHGGCGENKNNCSGNKCD